MPPNAMPEFSSFPMPCSSGSKMRAATIRSAATHIPVLAVVQGYDSQLKIPVGVGTRLVTRAREPASFKGMKLSCTFRFGPKPRESHYSFLTLQTEDFPALAQQLLQRDPSCVLTSLQGKILYT